MRLPGMHRDVCRMFCMIGLLCVFLAWAQRQPAADRRPVHVVASLNLTRHTGAIVSVTPGVSPQPQGAANDSVELVVRDAAGHELHRQAVSIQVTPAPKNFTKRNDQTALVDAAVPFHSDMAEIDLMFEGVLMAWYKNTNKVPQPVTDLQVTGESRSSNVGLSWTAASVPESKLTFTVQTSDSGAHWETIAEGLTVSMITLTEKQAHAKFARVIASNGFRNSAPTMIRMQQSQRPQSSKVHQ